MATKETLKITMYFKQKMVQTQEFHTSVAFDRPGERSPEKDCW